jgi:hypothetical protein
MDRTKLYRTVGVALAAAAVVSLTVPSSVYAGKEFRAKRGMTLYDADNRKLGKVSGLGDVYEPMLLLRVEGNLVALFFEGNGAASYGGSVLFTSADCSGQAYLEDWGYGIPMGTLIGSALYGRVSGEGLAGVSYNSRLGGDETYWPGDDAPECEVESSSAEAWPAFLAIPDLSTVFTPPFSIRVR